MGPICPRGNMTQIETLQDRIELLQREQRYLNEDIEDLLEKIENEKKTNELYMEA